MDVNILRTVQSPQYNKQIIRQAAICVCLYLSLQLFTTYDRYMPSSDAGLLCHNS